LPDSVHFTSPPPTNYRTSTAGFVRRTFFEELPGAFAMQCLDEGLRQLIQVALQQGHLTFSQVNAYLPDEAEDPLHLDNLIICLEELSIQLIPDPPVPVDSLPWQCAAVAVRKSGLTTRTSGAVAKIPFGSI
jgi:hypothetical protein